MAIAHIYCLKISSPLCAGVFHLKENWNGNVAGGGLVDRFKDSMGFTHPGKRSSWMPCVGALSCDQGEGFAPWPKNSMVEFEVVQGPKKSPGPKRVQALDRKV